MTDQERIVIKHNGKAGGAGNVQTEVIQQEVKMGEWGITKIVVVAGILLSIILLPIYILNVGSYDIEPETSFVKKEIDQQKKTNQDVDRQTEIKIPVEVIDEVQDVQISEPFENSAHKDVEKITPEPLPGSDDSLNQKKDIKQVIAESVNDSSINLDEHKKEEKEPLKSKAVSEDSFNQNKDIKQVIADSVTKSSAKAIDNSINEQEKSFSRESFDDLYLDYSENKKTRPLSEDNNPSPTYENNKDTSLSLDNNKISKKTREYSESTDKTKISRALLTTALINREPVDNIISFVKVSRQKDTKINYFTEIMDMNGKVLYHQWLWENQMEFNRKVNINGPRWRVSTKKYIPFSKPGAWVARLVNEENEILNEIKFEVIQK